ncbi:5'-nucleotidase C-terminal domain-containing protein [Winogradskyella sp. HB-48]|uniref:5'-nucleotidase C-terminal domain-containing protein n=1 Tax=Winogradskyella sp. HB-48 TaxID=3416808 RepID=UPI003CF8ABC8
MSNRIEGSRIEINDSIPANKEIEEFISPYRDNVNKNLDSVISYAPETYSKTDGELNTAIGNLMADAVFSESNPIFNKRTGKNIDFVLLNHGGIRAIISQGNITTRTAYEVMPFENSVVVVALKGKQINELFDYLSKAKRAHPVSKQVELVLGKDFTIKKALVNGKPVLENETYYVATNDYLYNGGDRMTFFQPNDSLYTLDYKIRNVLIDYFKKNDTINPKIDNRFTKL